MKFTVYSKNGCPYCNKVEKVLQLAKLQHVVYKLGTDFDREEFYSKFGEGSTLGKLFTSFKNFFGPDSALGKAATWVGDMIKPVMNALANGTDILFDIDWQGTQQLVEKAPDDVVSVFILPPSHAELERRLYSRAQDPSDIVARRMAKAAAELSHYAEYDYVFINNHLGESIVNIMAILEAERLKRRRMIGLSDFVKRLCEGG